MKSARHKTKRKRGELGVERGQHILESDNGWVVRIKSCELSDTVFRLPPIDFSFVYFPFSSAQRPPAINVNWTIFPQSKWVFPISSYARRHKKLLEGVQKQFLMKTFLKDFKDWNASREGLGQREGIWIFMFVSGGDLKDFKFMTLQMHENAIWWGGIWVIAV